MTGTPAAQGTWAHQAGRPRQVAALLAGAGLTVLLLAGCVVTVEDPATVPTKVTEVLARGEGRFDLTSPPDRDEAGMPDGRGFVTYQNEDHSPFEVTISLPEGHQLTLQASMVGFESYRTRDPTTQPPTTMNVQHRPPTLGAARDHLRQAFDTFDLDQQAIDDWYERASGPGAGPGPPTQWSRWSSTTVGHLELSVRGMFRPAADARADDRVAVHYTLTWGDALPVRD